MLFGDGTKRYAPAKSYKILLEQSETQINA